MTINGIYPIRGAATLDAIAVPTGPSFGPINTLICAAFGPLPTKASPIYIIYFVFNGLGCRKWLSHAVGLL